jgi:3-mercaptopyruvate sulfurtransferase SseA
MPLTAQTVRWQMLVSPEWLEANWSSVRIFHIGDRATYDFGHIPGAVLIEPASFVMTVNGIPNELPPLATPEQVFSEAGIDRRSRIVLYGADRLVVARAWFTLDYLGQGAEVVAGDR